MISSIGNLNMTAEECMVLNLFVQFEHTSFVKSVLSQWAIHYAQPITNKIKSSSAINTVPQWEDHEKSAWKYLTPY